MNRTGTPGAFSHDSRVAAIHTHLEERKTVCKFADPKRVYYAVAPEAFSPEALLPDVQEFRAQQKGAMILLAPEGFNAQERSIEEIKQMAQAMNEQIWAAFEIDAYSSQPDWNDEKLWLGLQTKQRFASLFNEPIRPIDIDHTNAEGHPNEYNIQGMGPWYNNQRHYRYAPGDLFMLLTRMHDIQEMRKKYPSQVQAILEDAQERSDYIDYMLLIAPESYDTATPAEKINYDLSHSQETARTFAEGPLAEKLAIFRHDVAELRRKEKEQKRADN